MALNPDPFQRFNDAVDSMFRFLKYDADIMYRLEVTANPGVDILNLHLKGTAQYVLNSGEIFDVVRESGIVVPSTYSLGKVAITSNFRGVERCGSEGRYADLEGITKAFRALNDFVAELSQHEINIKKVNPQARSNRCSPATVSVEGLEYFSQHAHFPSKPLEQEHLGKSNGLYFLANGSFSSSDLRENFC